MNLLKQNNFNFENTLDYFLAFFLVLNNQSVYQNSVQPSYHIYELTLLFLIVSVVYRINKYGIVREKYKIISEWAFVYYMYLTIFVVISVSTDTFVQFLSRYLFLPLVWIFFSVEMPYIKKIDVFRKFVQIMVAVSVISLFFWIFGSMLNIVSPSGTANFKWGNISTVSSYFNLYFETQYIDWIPVELLRRNTGIFVEGPMMNLTLVFSLLFIYYFDSIWHISKWKKIVLSLAILSTFSVLGYAVLFLYLCVNIYRSKYRTILLAIIPITILGMFYVWELKQQTGSYNLREDDYTIGIKTWLQSPIFGFGYNNMKAIISNMDSSRCEGFSNSIFTVLSQGGIYFASLFIIPILRGIFTFEHKRMVVSLIYFVLFTSVIFHTAYINFFIFCLMSPYFVPSPLKIKNRIIEKWKIRL